jgi:hypothetical protein
MIDCHNIDKILSRVRKLKRLAGSSNPNEAALAAAEAARIMLEYQLGEGELGTEEAVTSENPADVTCVWLDEERTAKRQQPWRADLANALVKSVGGKMWFQRSGSRGYHIQILAGTREVATIQYMHLMLSRELQRMREEAWDPDSCWAFISANTRGEKAGARRRWNQDFMEGAILVISQRLLEERQTIIQHAQMLGNTKALTRIDQRKQAIESATPKLRKGTPRASRHLAGGHEAGQQAGHKVNLGVSGGAITAGPVQLKG